MSATATDLRDDFPDRLSPMLVKELRQGLRARTFVAVFLVLQGLLGLILLSAGAAATSDRAGTVVSQVIFVFFSLAVLVIQPLRGIAALSGEIKGNTIDLMVLTRLSAWRIVVGKWVALVGQSALLLATIIPYLILRYYFGGMNLFAELLLVLLLFALSSALTAVTVGLSASSSILVRGLIPLAGMVPLTISIFGFGFSGELKQLVEVCSLESSDHAIGIAVFLLTIAYLAFHALSLGASLIAPHAENHATVRRLITLGTTAGLGGILLWQGVDTVVMSMMLGVLFVPAIVLALSEPEQQVATVYRPFVKKGFIGRLAGRFLYPGWATGVAFTALLVVIGSVFWVCLAKSRPHLDTEEPVVVLGMLGALLFPGFLTIFWGQKVKERFACFILLLIASGVFTLVLAMMAGFNSEREFLWLFIWNPLVITILTDWSSTFPDETLLVAAMIVDGVYFLLLTLKALPAFRRIRTIESEVSEA